mgnify:CR=1 FL=1
MPRPAHHAPEHQALVVNLPGGAANRLLHADRGRFQGAILGLMWLELLSVSVVGLFTAVFALARTVGWIAQLNEMIGDPEYKIGRPRQLFTGSVRRDVQPIASR